MKLVEQHGAVEAEQQANGMESAIDGGPALSEDIFQWIIYRCRLNKGSFDPHCCVEHRQADDDTSEQQIGYLNASIRVSEFVRRSLHALCPEVENNLQFL